jgi:hypothetical protein
MRSSEAAALCQFLGATKGVNMLFTQHVQHVEADLGGREIANINFMRNAICRPTENRVDLSIMTPTLWWYRPCYKGYLKLIRTGQQLRAGYNIVDGLRVESDPGAASNALNAAYNGGTQMFTGPARGPGRQRWIMRGNVIAAPAPLAAVAAGIGRAASMPWFSSVLGAIPRAAGVTRFISNIPLQVNKIAQLPSGTGALTIERLRQRVRHDAHGAVLLTAGLRKLLSHAEEPSAVPVRGGDF